MRIAIVESLDLWLRYQETQSDPFLHYTLLATDLIAVLYKYNSIYAGQEIDNCLIPTLSTYGHFYSKECYPLLNIMQNVNQSYLAILILPLPMCVLVKNLFSSPSILLVYECIVPLQLELLNPILVL